MGFKDLINKAKAAQKKLAEAKKEFDTKAEKSRAESLQRKAEKEATEARHLDDRLERLQAQEKKLRKKDATQSAIKAKKHQIKELESRVTTSGKIAKVLDREVTKFLKKSKKKPRKRRKK